MRDIQELRSHIPFKWRVQSAIPKANPTHVQMIAYIDARDVMERLDTVVGQANWQDKYYEVKGNLYCSLGIKIGDEWVWKSDTGTPSQTEAIKGECSDAFKRAAVKWGINRDAYSVGMVKLPCTAYGNKYYPTKDGKSLKGQELNDHCNSIAVVEVDTIDESEGSTLEMIKQLFEKVGSRLTPEHYKAVEAVIEGERVGDYERTYKFLAASK